MRVSHVNTVHPRRQIKKQQGTHHEEGWLVVQMSDGIPINPCSPKINFEIAQTNIKESGINELDCKKYTDYFFNMTISRYVPGTPV